MRWLVPLLLVATPLAGCGDDEPSYVDAVEEACDVRDKAFNDLVQPIPSEFSPEYVVAVVEGSVGIIATYLEDVREIGPPGGELDDEHEAYVALLEDTLAQYEAAVGDEARSTEVFNQPRTDFTDLEAALGLPTCGKDGNGLEPEESD